jgi:glutaminase
MKQTLWLVVATALVFGGLMSVVDLGARQTVPQQVHESDRLLIATDLDQLQRDAKAVADSLAENKEGKVYTAAVPGTDPDHLALAVALVDGRIFGVGDIDVRFPLMSVSKPFTYALALEQHGVDFMIDRIGVSATGFPYNAVAAGAVRRTSEQNPLVNAGAIATHGYIEGATPADKISAVIEFYSRMANRSLSIEETWRVAPRALTYTLAYQMKASGRLEGDVEEIAGRYLESNIVAVTVEDLATMGATLAAGGIQPQTGERILKSETVRTVLSVMVIAGMYEDSGLWWTRVGLPAKSGVSGAILAVVPGWGAIVAYSPRLDESGNSVRAALAIRELADRWDLHSIERLLKTEAQE